MNSATLILVARHQINLWHIASEGYSERTALV
jgi:hypothetical protein